MFCVIPQIYWIYLTLNPISRWLIDFLFDLWKIIIVISSNIIPIFEKKKGKMTLGQVVYQLSTDSEFAARMQTVPDRALAEKGIQLSYEEKAFLTRGLCRSA